MDNGSDDPRLRRVHVVGARAVKDGYVVVLSDPEFDGSGRPLRPDTWEVSWDAWVRARGRVADL